jgi:SAM-dependent methyltransferase
MMSQEDTYQTIYKHVREHYAQIAEQHPVDGAVETCGCAPAQGGCCGSGEATDTIQLSQISMLYETPDVASLPKDVTDLSLGCGDPVTLAALLPGQTVLDLGSGGGIDCFLAAKKVGPGGKVIGIDMTPAMLDKARANKSKIGADNVEFRLGEIEHLPVGDRTVDVVLSNCVINLSPDKPQVFREAYRVLRPGGKLAVSDVVTDGPLPESVKSSLSAWAGCVAGALDIQDYVKAMRAAGFEEISITPVYLPKEVIDEAADQLSIETDLGELSDEALYKTVFSAKITAYRPANP